eukprot:7287977-Lingulodinium_polyedra.AAC.1
MSLVRPSTFGWQSVTQRVAWVLKMSSSTRTQADFPGARSCWSRCATPTAASTSSAGRKTQA